MVLSGSAGNVFYGDAAAKFGAIDVQGAWIVWGGATLATEDFTVQPAGQLAFSGATIQADTLTYQGGDILNSSLGFLDIADKAVFSAPITMQNVDASPGAAPALAYGCENGGGCRNVRFSRHPIA